MQNIMVSVSFIARLACILSIRNGKHTRLPLNTTAKDYKNEMDCVFSGMNRK